MGYLSKFDILGSVGRNGVNSASDVRVIQTMLREVNQQPGEAGLDPGPVTGVCSSQTIRAIEVFQRRIMSSPDGRVDPFGLTLQNLKKVTFHDGTQPSYVPGCPTARNLVRLLQSRCGQKYVFGAAVPKNNANWIGPWDCAEFVAWGIFQLTRRAVGCRRGQAPNGIPFLDAFTGHFQQDLPAIATQITEQEAANLIGAIALRSPGNPGHIAVSCGGNRTIEAASAGEGVCSKPLRGRPWTSFWRLNSLQYDSPSYVPVFGV